MGGRATSSQVIANSQVVAKWSPDWLPWLPNGRQVVASGRQVVAKWLPVASSHFTKIKTTYVKYGMYGKSRILLMNP